MKIWQSNSQFTGVPMAATPSAASQHIHNNKRNSPATSGDNNNKRKSNILAQYIAIVE